MKPTVAIAPNFYLDADWAQRLRVPKGAGWRAPTEAEQAAMVGAESLPERVSLFVLPAHLRSAFWSMLQQQAEAEGGDFVAFAAEVARFLAFKQLATPTGAVLELVAQGTDGTLATHALWGMMNLGEDPLTLAWPTLRLELRAGEGCRLPRALPAVVLPPAAEPHLLLVVRGT